jgi:hypothetical protein
VLRRKFWIPPCRRADDDVEDGEHLLDARDERAFLGRDAPPDLGPTVRLSNVVALVSVRTGREFVLIRYPFRYARHPEFA